MPELPEYTILTVISLVAVVALELLVMRTGIFRMPRYWATILICLAFQIPVDGWLTKLSDPIVLYAPAMNSGIRFPWDIPIEDFGFGFSMITLVLMTWIRLRRRVGEEDPTAPHSRGAHRTDPRTASRPDLHRSEDHAP